MVFFFFSSRRRHTRWPRDWSSDVCSSDLVGDGRIGDQLVPVLDGDLAGHDCRAAAVAIVDDFQQVAALLRGQWCQSPIVKDQELHAREALEQAWIATIAACQRERVEQAGNSVVEDRA